MRPALRLAALLALPGLGACGGDAGACADTWTGFAGAYVQQSCGRCHGLDYQSVVDDATAIAQRVRDGSMPPDAALDADGKARLLAWLACGTPK